MSKEPKPFISPKPVEVGGEIPCKCPFCKSHNTYIEHEPMFYQAHCRACDARGPLKTSGVAAAEAWRNVTREDRIAKLKKKNAELRQYLHLSAILLQYFQKDDE